ncbi:MAG: hypothetical protein CMO81_11275 [Waddliaceae bacterium]|nr:hypothetical protein [Waddliaceae bacterium]
MRKTLQVDLKDKFWYLNYLETQQKEIQQLISSRTWESALGTIEECRGSMDFFGFSDLFPLFEELESAVEAETSVRCSKALERIQETLNEKRIALAKRPSQ